MGYGKASCPKLGHRNRYFPIILSINPFQIASLTGLGDTRAIGWYSALINLFNRLLIFLVLNDGAIAHLN